MIRCLVRRSGGMGIVAAMAVLLATAAPATAQTYATAGCDGAPTWRILYHLHFDGPSDRAGALPGVLANADRFAQEVGRLSECAVRVRVDVVFESGPFDARRTVVPGYDAAFFRYPETGREDFEGRAGGSTAIFPATRGTAEPGPYLLMHEWLHLVVGFYDTPLGWPAGNVHGGCLRPDYRRRHPRSGCMVLPSWFSDLMLGRVVENGRRKGLPREQWAIQGTPARPLNRLPALGLDVDRRRARVEVTGDDRQDRVQLTVADAAGAVLDERTLRLRRGLPVAADLPLVYDRPVRVCVQPTGEGWRPLCEGVRLRPRTEHLLRAERVRGPALRLSARRPLRGRTVTIRFTALRCGTRGCREARKVRRRIRLGGAVRVRYPRGMRPSVTEVSVTAPAFTSGGVRYRRTTWQP